MDDFKKLPKMQCFKEGGSVKPKDMCYGGKTKMKSGGEVKKDDMAQDKALIKKAFKQHDEAEHDKEPTEIKLKKGGRAKKAVGTVRKYKTGGSVDNVYGAKKKAGDLDNIEKTKDIKATKLCMGGKAVKKMADGGSTGLQQAALMNALPGKANEIERAQMAARARNAMKYLGPAQQSQFVNQGGMNPAPAQAAPAGSTVPAGRKHGGKVKKMNTGGTCS
jgi:hypothetical protein